MSVTYEKACGACGKVFATSIARAVVCSSTCRGRKLRARRAQAAAEKLGLAPAAPAATIELPAAPGRELRSRLDGLSPAILERLAARVAARNGENIDPGLRRLTHEQLKAAIDDKLSRALGWLDDAAMAMSSGKDLTIMAGVLIDKRAALAQEAPVSLTNEQRERLYALLARLEERKAQRAKEAGAVEMAPEQPR